MPYALDVDQLRTFVAIAELGSFTKAADAVSKTQSAVSMQMRRLEERVGKPIFARDGRQSRLTDQGHRLLDYARRMVRLNDETMNAFSDNVLAGTIKMGLPDDYAENLLPKALASFSQIHPGIEIQVECQQSSRIFQRVEAQDVDIGIVTSLDCRGMGRVFRRERLCWVTSQDRCVHEQTPIPLAIGPTDCSWRTAAISALDAIGRPYRIAYSSASAVVSCGAVQEGLAVSVLPESTVRDGLRILTEKDGFPTLPTCDIAMIRAVNATNPVHDTLADHIQNSIGNLHLAIAAE